MQPVFKDTRGFTHETEEKAEKAQKEIDLIELGDALINRSMDIPALQACCTRTGLNEMPTPKFLRTLISDPKSMEEFRDLLNKMLPKQRKHFGVTMAKTVTPVEPPAAPLSQEQSELAASSSRSGRGGIW